METKTPFKPLKYFFLAANSLLFAGLLSKPNQQPLEWLFLVWATFSGIFLTYRFNDFIDDNPNLDFDFKKFMDIPIHKFVVAQTFLLLGPVSLYYLSNFRLYTLAVIGFFGFLYSLKVAIGPIKFRLKHIFFIKNFLIGTCWGGLILVGSNELNTMAYALFIFTSIQVFIGSSIRDITDIKQDKKEYVQSLPVVLGLDKTLIVLGFFNAISLFIYEQMTQNLIYLIPAILTFLWRTLVLYQLKYSSNISLWSQRLNLLTCTVIFTGQLIVWIILF